MKTRERLTHDEAFAAIARVAPEIAGVLWDVPDYSIEGCNTAHMLSMTLTKMKQTTLRRIVKRLADKIAAGKCETFRGAYKL